MADRKVLKEALAFRRAGDVLVVGRPDRLARNTAELLGIVEDPKGREVGLVILSMGGERLDRRNPRPRSC